MMEWVQGFLKKHKWQQAFDNAWNEIPPYPGFSVLKKAYREITQWQHQQKVYSSSCASGAQDTQYAQDVNSHSGCDVDPMPRPEDSLNIPLRPDNVLKRTLCPVHPDAFRR